MSIYNSPGSASNEHIRHLLHQRTAPSNIHAHYPSLSEFPDSPSVYSHAQYTPRPFDHQESEHSYPSPTFTGKSISDSQSINLDSASSVELDDDSHSSYASSTDYVQDRPSFVADYRTDDDDDVEPEHRMSMLGIKMRFHSKAPWEMGEDGIVEEDEPEHASIHRSPSRSKRSLRTFGSRPSGESSRSGSVGKKSFETSASQLSARGALQALAQASMSTSSLAITPSPGQSNLRQKLSIPRMRTPTSNSNNLSVSTHPYSTIDTSPRPSPVSVQQHSSSSIDLTSPLRPATPLDARSFISRSPSPVGHPYANPELVRCFNRNPDHSKTGSQSEASGTVKSSDSLVTLTSSGRTTSPIDYVTPPIQSSHTHGAKDRHRTKEISGPIPQSTVQQRNGSGDAKWRETRIFPMSIGNGIAGWQEPQPSAFTLISLEEARAQRTRVPTIDSDGGSLNFPFPPSEQTSTSSSGTTILARSRVRSTSIGGKVRNREFSKSTSSDAKSEPTTPDGKSLKHKKSGFLRIFGKEKDRVPAAIPSPPFSTFSDMIPPVPRTPKLSMHRIPVPNISTKQDPGHDDYSNDSHDEETVSGHSSIPIPLPSINTSSSGSSKHSFGNNDFPSDFEGLVPSVPFATSPSNQDLQPQSAPPGTTDFIGLKLRPVSTMFSAHFRDHLIDTDSERDSQPSLVTDLGTPSTATNSSNMSPFSSEFFVRASPRSSSRTDKLVPQDDSQSDVVRALQNQIFTAKKAWQKHIWELEGQVRDLKAEIEELKHGDGGEHCVVCGRGVRRAEDLRAGVLNKSRAAAGSSRFGN